MCGIRLSPAAALPRPCSWGLPKFDFGHLPNPLQRQLKEKRGTSYFIITGELCHTSKGSQALTRFQLASPGTRLHSSFSNAFFGHDIREDSKKNTASTKTRA